MFYNKLIKIKHEGEKYKDEFGITKNGEQVIHNTLYADVQPYSKERLEKDYGYTDKCTKIVYLDLDNSIQINWIVEYDGVDYDIIRIVTWDNFMELMLDDGI